MAQTDFSAVGREQKINYFLFLKSMSLLTNTQTPLTSGLCGKASHLVLFDCCVTGLITGIQKEEKLLDTHPFENAVVGPSTICNY